MSVVLAGLVGALTAIGAIVVERWLVGRRETTEARRRAYARVFVASAKLVRVAGDLRQAIDDGPGSMEAADRYAADALDELNAVLADVWVVGSRRACAVANELVEKCNDLILATHRDNSFEAFRQVAGLVSDDRIRFIDLVRDELGLEALAADESGIDEPDWMEPVTLTNEDGETLR
jgi:hypothetical protein